MKKHHAFTIIGILLLAGAAAWYIKRNKAAVAQKAASTAGGAGQKDAIHNFSGSGASSSDHVAPTHDDGVRKSLRNKR